MGVLEIVKKQEREKGLAKGRLELEKERACAEAERIAEKLESARKFKEMGMSAQDISKGLNLSIEEIEKL